MKNIIVTIALCFILASCAPGASQAQQFTTQPLSSNTAQPSAIGTQTSFPTNPTLTPIHTTEPTSTPFQAIAATATPKPAATLNQTSTSTQPAVTLLPAATGAAKVPDFDHIILIVFENQSYDAVIGSSSMPHLNAFAKQYVLMTQYYAVSHPSLPNYIALMSGGTQGITSDCTDCFVDAPNLGDVLDANGRTWKAYEENMPSACYIGNANPYVQKHNPLLYFNSIRNDQTLCQNDIVPITQLDQDLAANQLPNFSFIEPNLCNSGHDCSKSTADSWLYQMVTKLQASPALGNNYLIAITYDEAATSDKSSCCGMGNKAGGRVATILISPEAKPGFTDTTPVSHYGLLKTILSAWNLPDIGFTSNPATQPITAPWK